MCLCEGDARHRNEILQLASRALSTHTGVFVVLFVEFSNLRDQSCVAERPGRLTMNITKIHFLST